MGTEAAGTAGEAATEAGIRRDAPFPAVVVADAAILQAAVGTAAAVVPIPGVVAATRLAGVILAEGIRAGELPVGWRLPPQRDLARSLRIDLTTVSRAIREAQQRGLIVTRGRAGSFVASPPTDPGSTSVIDLSINFPPPI